MNSITRRIIKCSIIHRFPTEAISGPARWAQICCLRHQPLVPQSTAGQVLRHLSDLPAALGVEEIDKYPQTLYEHWIKKSAFPWISQLNVYLDLY
jgi:hypothetical protein